MGNGCNGISGCQETFYFSPLMDLANREIIAYNFATRPKFSLVKKMLQGLSRLKPTECPIIHSDQGVLYGTAEWGNIRVLLLSDLSFNH